MGNWIDMNDLYTIKKVFKQHIALAQQVGESRILEQIAASAVIIKILKKTARRFYFAATAAAPQTASIWLLNL